MKKHKLWAKISANLAQIYPEEASDSLVQELQQTITEFKQGLPEQKIKQLNKNYQLSASDIALIVYGNTLEGDDQKELSLKVLKDFLDDYSLTKAISILHILPFYPWDTDRCFSVEDYYRVHPDYGTWKDIALLAKSVKLMFDFVANHASVKNPLVQAALIARHLKAKDSRYSTVKKYRDFVIAFSDKDKPLSQIIKSLARPRPNPVLTKYSVLENKQGKLWAVLGDGSKQTENKTIKKLGEGWVWTTFSYPKNPDGSEATRQVDTNFRNPKVLLEAVKIILFYIKSGARLIRLDAIGYIWKKLESSSLHEPEVHLILEVIKDILRITAPGILAIAEVNEPQDKVFYYLGKKGHEESDLVYQFTHFPLAIHAVLTKTTEYYLAWLKTLEVANGKQFITVLGTHDGLGLKPVRGFLPEKEIERFTKILVEEHQALPNYASLPGGKKIVYEICATPWNLINKPKSSEPLNLQLARYQAVLALGLMHRGIPAIYFNGLVGAPNYLPSEGLDENRTINRQIFKKSWLYQKLNNQSESMHKVFKMILKLLKIRGRELAFNPKSPALKPLIINNHSIIAVLIPATDKSQDLLALVNVSNSSQIVKLDLASIKIKAAQFIDLINQKSFHSSNNCQLNLTLKPYQTLWLKQLS